MFYGKYNIISGHTISVTGPEKTTQNTPIMLSISFSVCAIQNL